MLVVGIAGGSGSGKTTVVNRIMERLRDEDVAILPQDAYYKDNSQLDMEARQEINFDHPDSLEFTLLIKQLKLLREGRSIERPIYTYITCTRSDETIPMKPREVILLEGILIFTNAELRKLIDIKVFVDADADDRLGRIISRDIQERGRSVNKVLERYEKTVKPMHLQFIEPSKRYADIIVPQGGNNLVAIDILAATMLNKLNNVAPMMYELKLENVLFLDIETVPAVSFDELTERQQSLWEARSKRFRGEEESPEDVWSRAGLYAEFGKIVCISAGIFSNLQEPRRFRIKSFYGDDELKIMSEFGDLIRNYKKGKNLQLCAHNGKEFDFPYMARRYVILGERLPDVLNIAGKKPWELNFIDTMELWKFGEYRNYSSLALLTEVLGISNPKDDLDGSQVWEVYNSGDYERIARYCEKDVLAVAQVLLRLRSEKLIPEENVEVIGSNGWS